MMRVSRSKPYRPATMSGRIYRPLDWDRNAAAIKKMASLRRIGEPRYGPSLWNRIRGWLHI